MQRLIWEGAGEGTYENPFKLLTRDTNSEFDFKDAFNIFFENNYVGFKQEETYIKIDERSSIYLLANMREQGNVLSVVSEGAVHQTLFLTDMVDVTDGPYFIAVLGGISYIIKQQIFGEYEASFIEVLDTKLDELATELKRYSDLKDADQDIRIDTIESDIEDIKEKDIEQDNRLDIIEDDIEDIKEKDIGQDNRLDIIEDDIEDIESDIEDINLKDVDQDNRLNIIESDIIVIEGLVKIDDKTITRNDDQELEVNLKYIMDGGYL